MSDQMQITIINVDSTPAVTKTGKDYKFLDVTYKNLTFQGKVESKKVMPFGSKEVYATLERATKGQTFTLLREKDKDGYWQWISIVEGEVQLDTTTTAQPAGGAAPRASTGATVAPKSTYETAEERAKKQVYIIRQSSISSAIAMLKNDKKAPSADEVLDIAKLFEAYVFGINLESDAVVKLPELGDEDLPY